MSALPPIAVIAGGLGSRLHPVTRTIPKSLVIVGGSAFIDHQLRLFARRGLTKVVFCVGHMGEKIEAHVARSGTQGLDVVFSHDGEHMRGTGGAVKNALPLLGDEFFVTYGDSYLDIDYGDVAAAFRASLRPALMTVFRNNDSWDRSNVTFDGSRVVHYDKKHRVSDMHFIDYGFLAMRRSCFDTWEENTAFDLADLLSPLARHGCLAGYEVGERFYETGSLQGLADFETFLVEAKKLI